MSSEKTDIDENINLLKNKFKTIADITVSFERYDIILYSYDEIEQITKFIEEETDIESWTALKTKLSSVDFTAEPDFE
jgi:hypothetical protein